MLEALIEQLWLIISILCGFTIALRFTKNTIDAQDWEADKLKLKQMRAQIARLNVAPNLQQESSDIDSILTAVAPHLPSWLRPLANNPAVVKAVKDNPDVVKGIIDKVTKGGGIKETDNTTGLSL